ncbi:putative RTX-family protein [Yersinia mollaretii]|uniref:C80 family cysteine peptidase n=1 Tax=Yersinia mollaretii TaxID=33060 RepID=UPI0005E48790|nr:C80 family cysteine peptidase [Yersinia mollaretii]CNK88558.1 putative RTX-family protein [Yersinia mollaretii]
MKIDGWGIPNKDIIHFNNNATASHLDYDYQVIIQLSDDASLRKNIEFLASKHPNKTLIIQYDIHRQESRIVHGSLDKLQGSRVRWILSGHGDGGKQLLAKQSAEEVYTGIDLLKKHRNMVSPERIILLSCVLGINPYDRIKKHFALEYAEIMQKNKDKASLRAYNQLIGVVESGRRITNISGTKEYFNKNTKHRVDYHIKDDGQLMINNTPIVAYILMNIAHKKISAIEAIDKYKKHLVYLLSADSDGNIDTNILSKKANNFLEWLQARSRTHSHVTHNQDNTGQRIENPSFVSEMSQHEVSLLKDNVTRSELDLRGNNRLRKTANNLGWGNQIISTFRLGISTSVMLKKLNSSEITQEEKKEINEAFALSWSEFSVDFGIDIMQPYFEKGAMYFAKKVPLTKGISQLGSRAGSLIAKSAGSALNIASAGFDIYNVVQIYGQLERDTNPDSAKDLIVNGTLSALGAGVGILTAAALAVGFAIAGPLGILAGIGISLAAMIYNAVSTIAKIKEQIDLTPWEEFKNGTRLAFGADLEQSISARLEEKQKCLLRENIDQYAQEIANKRLIPSGVTEYYYVYDKYGEVKKIHYYYINKNNKDYLLNVISSNNNNFVENGDEFTHKETGQVLSEDIYKKNWVKCSYREYEEYRVNEKFSVEKRLDSIFDVSGNTPIAIIIDNEYFEGKYSDDYVVHDKILALDKARTEHTGHLELSPSANKKVHFNTGVGDSYVFADRHVQNSFDITQGTKTFVGGDLNDIFYLYGNELLETFQPSQLDGRKGEDTLAIMGVHQEGVIGYKINLMAGTIHYHTNEIPLLSINAPRVLMNISNIEHIHSAEDTDDILMGDDQVNVLNGMGGRDILKGHGGDDMLSLQSGEVDGGAGSDNYKILQNKKSKAVSVTLFEQPGNEVSNVILDYALQNIDNIYLSGNDVCIELKNENNTLTTLMLKGVYSDLSEGDRKKNNDFLFYTKDGFILEPQWQAILVSEGSHSDGEFNPTLAVYQFSNKSSPSSDVNNPIPSTFISKKNGVNIIRIDNVNVELKYFIDPMLVGHDFSSDILEGSEQDDLFNHLGAGDEIYVSQGNDNYIIDNLVLPDTTQRDRLILSNSGKHDWTTGQDQTFFLNDISGDDLQITSKILNGEQEVIISHKHRPDEYLKIKLPMPEESNLVYNQFYVVDKDEKRFIVRYNFLEAIISPESPPEITVRRHLVENSDYLILPKEDELDVVVDDGLVALADDTDDMGQLINDMGNIPVQKPQHTFLSNFYSHFDTSNLPPVVAVQ